MMFPTCCGWPPNRGLIRVLVVAVWLLAADGLPARAQSSEWWSQLTADLWRRKAYRLAFYADARVDGENGEFAGWGAGFLNFIRVHPNLTLGLHARRFDVRPFPGEALEAGDRLEFEVNPRFELAPRWELTFRNRAEFRWAEEDGAYSSRLRSRAQLEWSAPESWPVRAVYLNNEVLYSVTAGNWSENRLVPLGVVIPLGKQADLRVYYALRHRWYSSGWESGHLFGTHVVWTR